MDDRRTDQDAAGERTGPPLRRPAEHPALDSTNLRISWLAGRAKTQNDLQHAEKTHDGVEAILAVHSVPEAVRDLSP
jgi:hypothetical protein